MCSRADAGCHMHVQAHEVSPHRRGETGVDPHSNSDLHALRPGGSTYRPLDRRRRPDSGIRGREHREESVTLGVHLTPRVAQQMAAHHGVMALQQLAIGAREQLEESGGSLDVREQQRELRDVAAARCTTRGAFHPATLARGGSEEPDFFGRSQAMSRVGVRLLHTFGF